MGRILTMAQRQPSRGEEWRERVRRVVERDGPGCFYCRRPVDLERARLDHFVPTVQGGNNGLRNRRLACPGCDGLKGGRMPWDVWPDRFSPPTLT